MYNWKMPYVNSPLKVCGIALWLHKIFTEVKDKTLWSIKSSISAVFLKIHLCENKKNFTLVRILSIFSNLLCEHLPDIGGGTLPTTVLTLIKTEDA